VTLLGCAGCAHWRSENEVLIDGQSVRIPIELKRGTASREQVEAWTRSQCDGPNKQLPLVTDELDLNQDGKEELLLADRDCCGATGNGIHLAFEQTAKGYRYIDSLGYSAIHVVPRDTNHGPYIYTSWHGGGGELGVQLSEWDSHGFHCVAGIDVKLDVNGAEPIDTITRGPSGTSPTAMALLKQMFSSAAKP